VCDGGGNRMWSTTTSRVPNACGTFALSTNRRNPILRATGMKKLYVRRCPAFSVPLCTDSSSSAPTTNRTGVKQPRRSSQSQTAEDKNNQENRGNSPPQDLRTHFFAIDYQNTSEHEPLACWTLSSPDTRNACLRTTTTAVYQGCTFKPFMPNRTNL